MSKTSQQTLKRESSPATETDWHNPRNASRKAKPLDEEQQRELLAGLPRYSMGAQVLLGEPLIAPNGTWLDGHAWLPKKDGNPGERFPHWILGVDLGKFQFKYGGVDDDHYFQRTFVIDAYVKAQAVEYDPKGGEQVKGLKSWTLLMEHGALRKESTAYWLGEEALPWVKGKFPLLVISMRIKEQRFREQYYAGLAMQLEALGVPFHQISDRADLKGADLAEAIAKAMESAPTHHIIVALALPHKDMKNMNETTRDAIHDLEGDFVVMRTNTATGQQEVVKGHVSNTYVFDQPRGTDTAISLQADGEAASWDTDWSRAAQSVNNRSIEDREVDENGLVTARTIADPGGGDCHIYQINDEGTVTYLGSWQGDGTIEIARALIPVIEKNHGITLSEAQAQTALYKMRVRGAGGRSVRIEKDIASLHYEIDNLIARIDIKEEMRSSLIVCTGGGTAVFGSLLKTKLEGMGLKEKEHFLILNKELAPIANAAGVTLRACLKAQDTEATLNEKVLFELMDSYQALFDVVSPRRYELRSQISSILEQLQRYAEALDGADPVGESELPALEWSVLAEYLKQRDEVQEKVA